MDDGKVNKRKVPATALMVQWVVQASPTGWKGQKEKSGGYVWSKLTLQAWNLNTDLAFLSEYRSQPVVEMVERKMKGKVNRAQDRQDCGLSEWHILVAEGCLGGKIIQETRTPWELQQDPVCGEAGYIVSPLLIDGKTSKVCHHHIKETQPLATWMDYRLNGLEKSIQTESFAKRKVEKILMSVFLFTIGC